MNLSTNASCSLAAPEFAEVGNHFLVTVYKKRISGFIQGAPVETRETTREKSNEKVLRLIAKNPAITTGALSAKLNLSVSGIAKIIRNLKKKQKLRRIGPDKGGHWEVLPR